MADAVSDAPAGSPRRGSFLETWRVFASGWGKVGMLGLFFAGWIVIGTIVMGVSGRRALAPNVLMLLSMLPVATYSLERQLADRLAFLSLIPQPVPTKWLVLAPMCALGLLTALASGALSSKAPAISILALLGSAWWMVGSARWLHRFGPWIVVACVFVLLAPVASFVAYRVGGWAAAAAVAMALGVGALLFQPNAYVGPGLRRRPGEKEERSVAPPVPQSRRAASVAPAKRGSALAASGRFVIVSMEASPWFLALLFLLMGVMGLMSTHRNTLHPSYLMLAVFVGTKLIAKTYSNDTQDFLGTIPIARGPRVIGGVVFPLLLILFGHVVAALMISRELLDQGGLLGRLFGRTSPNDDTIGHLREVLGATFLPEKWPAGGLSIDLWLRLRPLLYMDLLRSALLFLTLVFAAVPFVATVRGEKLRPPLNIVLVLLVVASALRLDRMLTSLPIPPLWFAALLAVVAIADWWRRARAGLPPASSAEVADRERRAR